MLLGHLRRDMDSTFNTSHFAASLPTPMSASSTATRTPTTAQPTMMNYARMPHRYTSATLLSLRPPTEITIFPDHLVERRFLDEENYIDMDRMLVEKAGKFDLESFNMTEGPIMPSRIHKYDFSDPVVIEKVKNRRPKDPLTPQQVAALTSVATRHQPSTLLLPYQSQPAHVWIDDYSHQQVELNAARHHFPPQPSMPYQRQNPNQCDIYTKQIKSLLPTYETMPDEEDNPADTIPILQRLFAAQRLQQNEHRKIDSSSLLDVPPRQSYLQGLSAFGTPATPQKPHAHKTLEWLSTPDRNRKDILAQLLHCSTTMETPVSPAVGIHGSGNKDDDEEQNFYSAPPSPTRQGGESLSLFANQSSFPAPLESWFGTSIYTSAYPRMPSDRVLAACDLEQ